MLNSNDTSHDNDLRSNTNEQLNGSDCNNNSQSERTIQRPEFPESRSIKEGVYPAKPTWGK